MLKECLAIENLSHIERKNDELVEQRNASQSKMGIFIEKKIIFMDIFSLPSFQSSQQIECDINNKSEISSMRLSTVILFGSFIALFDVLSSWMILVQC